MHRLFIACCLLILTVPAGAQGPSPDGPDQLRRFLDTTTSMTAEFRQSLFTAESAPAQVSEGRLMIKRPGRFRWEYVEPPGQLVVGDGQRVWMYDEDLEQVTVRPVDETLRGTPAMLLSGQATLDETFEVLDSYEQEGRTWVVLRPRSGSPEFESLRIGLVNGSLDRMELRDSLGQSTRIEFIGLRIDPVLDDSLFQFVPPAGADVIGQGAEL